MSDFLQFVKTIGFDVAKYDSLKDSSDYDIILQLRTREKISEWVNVLFSDETADHYIFNIDMDERLEDIFIRNLQYDELSIKQRHFLSFAVMYSCVFKKPLDNTHYEKYFQDYEAHLLNRKKTDFYKGNNPYELAHTDNVKPLSRWDLECFIFSKAKNGIGSGERIMPSLDEIERMDDEEPEKLYTLANESLNSVLDNEYAIFDWKNEMLLRLNLDKTDDELIKDLRVLLPSWRQELNIDAPQKKRDWNYVRSRIINYKIIPLLDILTLAEIYTLTSKKRVPKRIIALLVYPDGERDGFGLEQTVMPFLEKVKGKSSKLIADYKINK